MDIKQIVLDELKKEKETSCYLEVHLFNHTVFESEFA